MNTVAVIVGVAVWLFVDIYLGIKVKNISNSNRQRRRKFALIGLNILLGIAAIFIALAIWNN
ncbi:MAG: membrane protein DedA with SNARE-associated domain [bacterium]|jgi:membrane protein DedA with SNARE-associated domain